jgi:Beta-lactamase
MKADRLEQVTNWLASRLSDRHFGAQLVVLRDGRVVLDRSVGSTNRDHARVTPCDRFVVYSLGKPFAALCVHLLGERGVDSGGCRSAFRNDVDQDYELMSITIPTRCRSQIGPGSEQ